MDAEGSYNIATFQTTQPDSYAEVNIKNYGIGTNASADLVLWNDVATESSSFVDLGINSSNYNGGQVGYGGDGYLFNQTNDMYVGSIATGNHGHTHIFGGNLWQSSSISIYNNGTIGINTDKFDNTASTIPTSGYAVEISGSVIFDNDIKVIGTISTDNYTLPLGDGSAGQTIVTDGFGNLTWSMSTSGTSGSSGIGANGSSGTSGTSGVGTSGTSGTSGVNGSSGTSGGTGSSGTSGISGTSGTSGSSGTSPTNATLKTTGSWTVPAGASTQSFTVESGASYTMWVNGNIPYGIITWNATVTTSNTNVPVVGSQYGWYYTTGNALVLTSMPDQIIGTSGSIATTPTSYAPNTSNVFKFGITNNSGTSQTINYGYIKLS